MMLYFTAGTTFSKQISRISLKTFRMETVSTQHHMLFDIRYSITVRYSLQSTNEILQTSQTDADVMSHAPFQAAHNLDIAGCARGRTGQDDSAVWMGEFRHMRPQICLQQNYYTL